RHVADQALVAAYVRRAIRARAGAELAHVAERVGLDAAQAARPQGARAVDAARDALRAALAVVLVVATARRVAALAVDAEPGAALRVVRARLAGAGRH